MILFAFIFVVVTASAQNPAAIPIALGLDSLSYDTVYVVSSIDLDSVDASTNEILVIETAVDQCLASSPIPIKKARTIKVDSETQFSEFVNQHQSLTNMYPDLNGFIERGLIDHRGRPIVLVRFRDVTVQLPLITQTEVCDLLNPIVSAIKNSTLTRSRIDQPSEGWKRK